METPNPTRALHVLCQPAQEITWRPFVADVAAIVAAPVAIEHRPTHDIATSDSWPLAYAAATNDPVLVLPTIDDDRSLTPNPRLQRMLVPTDRSLRERTVLTDYIRRAETLGIEVQQLHVLSDTTRPTIWEGPGHHAQAWHRELGRRHQLGSTTLEVRSGDPIEVLGTAADTTDLVMVCWKGHPANGQATIVTSILQNRNHAVLLLR